MEEETNGYYIIGRGWVEISKNIKVVSLLDVDEYV